MRNSSMLRTLGLVWGVLACVVLTSQEVNAEQFTMKIGTQTRSGDKILWMDLFKENVEARTNGRISIKLFPSSQLGAVPQQIQGMQLGTIEAWVGPPSFLKGVDPAVEVVGAPGVFRDIEHAKATISDPEFRGPYLDLLAEKGIKAISVWPSSISQVITKGHPIERVSDFRGRKIRIIPSAMEIETLKRLGAAPIPMPPSEVLPALQQGVIDGVQSGLVIFVPFKYWNVAPYLAETNVSYISSATFISRKWWDKLPEDIQKVILEEGRDLEDKVFEWGLQDNAKMRKTWLEKGGKITQFSPSERAKLVGVVESIGSDVVAKNPRMKAVFELMLEVSKRH